MTTKQKPLKFQPHEPKIDHPEFHFYASSIAEWRTSQDPEKLIRDMKRQNMPFNLFYVPLPETATYKIFCWAPQVEGTLFMGFWGREK